MKKPSLYALAKKGDLKALGALVDETNERSWLLVAAACGHRAASSRIEDLEDDDEGLSLALAHWEVGCWWLLGENGLPVDPSGSAPLEPTAPNWLEGVVFGLFAGFVGGTLAWVAIRYPRR